MAKTRQTTRRMLYGPKKPWSDLSLELRRIILEIVAEGPTRSPTCKTSSVAPYASVCHEWQFFFEQITFRRLVVDNFMLETLKHLVAGPKKIRISYIRHLWLRIKLPEYSCLSCKQPESSLEIHHNNRTFSITMHKLLTMLATWKGCAENDGMTLEISIHSPSDIMHRIRDVRMEDEFPLRFEEDILNADLCAKEKVWSQKRRAEINPSRSQQRDPHWSRDDLSVGEIRRFLGAPLDFQKPWSSVLPKVPIVDGLLIRQQFYRQMSPVALAKLFRQSLTFSKWFTFERWCRSTPEEETIFENALRDHLLPALPPSLHKFFYRTAIFKNKVLPIYKYDALNQEHREPPSLVAALLDDYSRNFTELVVNHPLNTIAFEDYLTTALEVAELRPRNLQTWSKLENICLESAILRSGDSEKIRRLLIAAASAAETMPNLRLMEIWTCGHRNKAIFHYSIKPGSEPAIELCGHGIPANLLNFQVVQHWRQAVSMHAHRELVAHTEFMPPWKPLEPVFITFNRKYMQTQFLHPLTKRLRLTKALTNVLGSLYH